MKRTAIFVLILMVSVALLSGCGGQVPAATPTANHLVEFNEQGIATLRGYVVSDAGALPKGETISIDVPVKMDGMDVAVNVPFRVKNDTIVSSTATKQTDVLEFLSFHQGAAIYEAFPTNALVEVTFLKTGTAFEAISVHEVEQGFRLFNSTPKIEPLFPMPNFAEGELSGHISQSSQQSDGTILWRVAVPIMMQGRQASVMVLVQSALDTEVVNTGGNIVMLEDVSGDVQIRFTRSKNALTAHQVTIITP